MNNIFIPEEVIYPGQALPDRSKVLVTDLDGTKIRPNSMVAVLDRLAELHLIRPDVDVSRLNGDKINWKTRQGSFDDFAQTVITTYLEIIKGVSIEDIQDILQNLIDDNKFDEIYVFSKKLVDAAHKAGYYTILLSHSHHTIVSFIGKYFGFNMSKGTMTDMKDGVFTGGILPGYGTSFDKGEVLNKIVQEKGLSLNEHTIAIGDTSSDIPMFEEIGKHGGSAICINPSRKLYERMKTEPLWHGVWERKDLILSDIPSKANPVLRDIISASGLDIEDIDAFARR